MDAKKIRLRHHLAPGDSLVMTACVESLARQFPGQYRVSVETTCMEIWENNPHVHQWEGDGQTFELQYPKIHESHMMATGHFMGAFCHDLAFKLGIPLTLQVNRPALYLTDDERSTRPISTPYMLVNAGTKRDFTCKAWAGYQSVVDHFRGRVQFVQIGETCHLHKPLDGVINLLGRTSPRELFQLVYHGLGGIGPTTFLQHCHAALSKFYVCIAGAREPAWWLQYPTQTTLSTMGQLPCCRESACWKSRVVPLGDGDDKDRSLCALPVLSNGAMVPACMDAIAPSMVIQSIESYIKHVR